MTRRTQVSAVVFLLVVLVGVVSIAIRERGWEVSYYAISGDHIAKDEPGEFLYVDMGLGIVEILSVGTEGLRLVGTAGHFNDSFPSAPIAVSRGWLYSSTQGEGEFMAFDVRSPANVAGYGPAHLGMVTYDIAVHEDLVLVAGYRWVGPNAVGTIVALNMSNPPLAIYPNGSADTVFRIDFPSPVYGIAADGSLMYAVEGTGSGIVHVIDLQRQPPVELLNYSSPITYTQVAANGSIIAVGGSLDNRSHIQLLRWSGDRLDPLVQFAKSAGMVTLDDGKMYVSGEPEPDPDRRSRDLSIYDLSDPAAPRLTGYVPIRGFGMAHVVSRGTVYSLGYDNLAEVRPAEQPLLVSRGFVLPYLSALVATGVVTSTLWHLDRRALTARDPSRGGWSDEISEGPSRR